MSQDHKQSSMGRDWFDWDTAILVDSLWRDGIRVSVTHHANGDLRSTFHSNQAIFETLIVWADELGTL